MVKKYLYFNFLFLFIPLFASQNNPLANILNSTLIAATDHGSLSRVKEMLDRGAYIDYRRPSYGDTALVVATRNNHEDIALELLRRGANPNIPSLSFSNPLEAHFTPPFGTYPLHLAAWKNNTKLIKAF